MVSRDMMHPGCRWGSAMDGGGTPSGKYDFRVQWASKHLPVTMTIFFFQEQEGA
jgi:hypothetical protein